MPWNILLNLAQRMTDVSPLTGRPIPFMVFFDTDRQLRFEAIDYAAQDVVAQYSSVDASGTAPIIGKLQVFNSVQQMRTDLHFQSIDPRTGDLLYQYLPMPNSVKRAVGFAFPWMERSARFGGSDSLAYVLQGAAWSASLPNQTARFVTIHNPFVHAGMLVQVTDPLSLGRTMTGVITSLRSQVGMLDPASGAPDTVQFSQLEVRDIKNLL